MGLDIRLPTGLMFAILGLLLAGYGLLGDRSIYERSLGININLIWGAVLIVFSGILLFLESRKARSQPNTTPPIETSARRGPETGEQKKP